MLGAGVLSQSLQEGPLNHWTPYPAHHWGHGVSCNPGVNNQAGKSFPKISDSIVTLLEKNDLIDTQNQLFSK